MTFSEFFQSTDWAPFERRWFRELFKKAAADRRAGIESIYVRSASLTERLLADQREVRVLHGDIHHHNIRQSSRGWLAFDPKGVVGERTYDCANTLCNPVMPELVHNETRLLTNAAILADTLAIDLPRVLGVYLRLRLPKRELVVTAHWYERRGRYCTVASQCRCDHRAAPRANVWRWLCNWSRF